MFKKILIANDGSEGAFKALVVSQAPIGCRTCVTSLPPKSKRRSPARRGALGGASGFLWGGTYVMGRGISTITAMSI